MTIYIVMSDYPHGRNYFVAARTELVQAEAVQVYWQDVLKVPCAIQTSELS